MILWEPSVTAPIVVSKYIVVFKSSSVSIRTVVGTSTSLPNVDKFEDMLINSFFGGGVTTGAYVAKVK